MILKLIEIAVSYKLALVVCVCVSCNCLVISDIETGLVDFPAAETFSS